MVSAGTAIRESVALLRDAGAEVVGVVTALDRQEVGAGESAGGKSAIAQVCEPQDRS